MFFISPSIIPNTLVTIFELTISPLNNPRPVKIYDNTVTMDIQSHNDFCSYLNSSIILLLENLVKSRSPSQSKLNVRVPIVKIKRYRQFEFLPTFAKIALIRRVRFISLSRVWRSISSCTEALPTVLTIASIKI